VREGAYVTFFNRYGLTKEEILEMESQLHAVCKMGTHMQHPGWSKVFGLDYDWPDSG